MSGMKTPWVVMDVKEQPPQLVCMQCGRREPVKLPCPIKLLNLCNQVFQEKHKKCKENKA